MYNAAIAEACRPGATVESVLQTVQTFATHRAEKGNLYTGGVDVEKAGKFAYDTVARDLNRALTVAAECRNRDELWERFNQIYSGGYYLTYGLSTAAEIVSKGLALFALHRGDPAECILTATNFARDTDCLAAIAGGLASTLSGTSALPAEWITQVNEATRQDPYTNSRRTIEETADGLLDAFGNRCAKLQDYLRMMGQWTMKAPQVDAELAASAQ